MPKFNESRLKRICEQSIRQLNLDLTGLKVVTEAATGLFAITPVIAALAGAQEVVCLGKDNVYGTYEEAQSNIIELARKWGISNICMTNNRNDEILKGANIITNLGNVRPLDSELLQNVGQQVVIPYMCESWEMRNGDVDFEYCQKKGIPIMGTDENHPNVGVFNYCGVLAIKLILEAGFEILGNKIAVISSDHFGPIICQTIRDCGGEVINFAKNDDYFGIEKQQWDIVLVAEYSEINDILGKKGLISGNRLEVLLSRTDIIIQFAGANQLDLLKEKVNFYPAVKLSPNRMARTLADLGIWPVVLLHVAGLAVGEKMARAKAMNLTEGEFEKFVLEKSPAQVIS